MTSDTEDGLRKLKFRAAITTFIDERREAKLKGVEGEAAEEISSRYEQSTWLARAALRVSSIEVVTHTLKSTHGKAIGSSLYAPPNSLQYRSDVGTHSLGGSYAIDSDCNAADLPYFNFLVCEFEGKRFLDWLLEDDQDFLAALHDDPATAREWANAFKALVRPAANWASHTLAKQVYWCVGDTPADDASFHLLQPVMSSALAHAAWADINDSVFSKTNAAARKARREKQPFEGVYRHYPRLISRKLGGTKPLNISQLNSERGGVNYLLASLPPKWKLDLPKKMLNIDSALSRFRYHDGVPHLTDQLCALLLSKPDPTMEVRVARERIEQALGDELAAFGSSVRDSFEPGWTRDAACRLPLCEQIWLDPDRAELPPHPDYADADLEFQQALEWKDWPDEVALRFANWVNALLVEKGLPVGVTEQRHWAKQALVDAAWPATLTRHGNVGKGLGGQHD
jgi:CRISPR-associated protein Csy1